MVIFVGVLAVPKNREQSCSGLAADDRHPQRRADHCLSDWQECWQIDGGEPPGPGWVDWSISQTFQEVVACSRSPLFLARTMGPGAQPTCGITRPFSAGLVHALELRC